MGRETDLFGITFEKGDVVFREGDTGDNMYIIQSGAVEISQLNGGQKQSLAFLERGDFFGEMALIDRHPRTATATVISRSRLLPFTRTSLLERIHQDPDIILHLLKTLCLRIAQTNTLLRKKIEEDETLRSILEDVRRKREEVSAMRNLGEGQEDGITTRPELSKGSFDVSPKAEDMPGPSIEVDINKEECIRFGQGESIFQRGDPGDSMFIILEGEVEISRGSGDNRCVMSYLRAGDFFGETAILTEQSRTASAAASRNTILLQIKRDEFLGRMKAEPELAFYILKGLIIRLRTMLNAMADPEKSVTTMAKNLPPLLKKGSALKTAVISLSTCGGCAAVILENQEELMQLLKKMDISYCPMLIDEEEIGEVDVAVVDGMVRVKEDEEKLLEVREKSAYIVAWGTCAVFGGIPACANQYELEDLLQVSYGHTQDAFSYYFSGTPGVDSTTYQETEKDLKLLRRARKLDDFVKVDFYLPGCPPNVSHLNMLVSELRGDGQSIKPKAIVCAECNRKHTKEPVDTFLAYPKSEWNPGHCLTSRGSVCLGFVTKGGCGAVCPRGGLPCWGCRGPSESASKKMEEGRSFEEYLLSSMIRRHPSMEDQVSTTLRIFRKNAMSILKFHRHFSSDRSRIR